MRTFASCESKLIRLGRRMGWGDRSSKRCLTSKYPPPFTEQGQCLLSTDGRPNTQLPSLYIPTHEEATRNIIPRADRPSPNHFSLFHPHSSPSKVHPPDIFPRAHLVLNAASHVIPQRKNHKSHFSLFGGRKLVGALPNSLPGAEVSQCDMRTNHSLKHKFSEKLAF